MPTDPVAGLIDIPLPQPISLWPQTLTSRIAVLLLAASAVAALWWFIRHWRANRYRREALAELKCIARSKSAGECDEEQALQLSRLVRRTALAAFPRETVASLTGSVWLAFLDRSYGGREFSQGTGRLLASAPYRHMPPGSIKLQALTRLVRKWIKVHHA
jgi:hypothetical protein